MTTAIADAGLTQGARYGSISRGRHRTLYWSYFFLILFVIFFLTPPVYMFITSLKSSAEISAASNPWWVYHPTWANFLYGLAFTTSADQLTLPVGIVTTLIRGDVYAWGQIMTGALLGAAPPLIIYAFLMDYYIAGLTAGATKG